MSAVNDVLELVNASAEKTVLAFLIRGDGDAAVQMADKLRWQDFAIPQNQVAFQAISNVLHSTEAVDRQSVLAESITVARDLKVKTRLEMAFFDELDTYDTRRAPAYAETVSRLSWHRRAGDFAQWYLNSLAERPDPGEFFAESHEKMTALMPPSTSGRFVLGPDAAAEHEADIEQREKDAKAGITNPFTWPWPHWNQYVRPLRPGMIGLVAALPGMGKSTVLDLIAEHWALSGIHVTLVHLEDSRKYKKDRQLARWAKVSLRAIEDGTTTAEERRRIVAAQANIRKFLPTLHYLEAAGMSMSEIQAELTFRHEKGEAGAAVVDYLDKVHPSRSQVQLFGNNIWERQSHDLEILKTMAEKLHIPVMTANQGNKSMGGENKGNRAGIQGSGAKTQKPQLVLIMDREKAKDSPIKDDEGTVIALPGEYSPVIEWTIEKQNRGRTGNLFNQFLIGERFDIVDIERVEL
jgi:replicative DNA helicase